MAAVDDFNQLRCELEDSLTEVLAVARSAASTRAAAWRSIVDALIGRPPRELPPAGSAANPAEVRRVLVALHASYVRRLHEIERALAKQVAGDAIRDDVWTFRHHRLATFVDDEVAGYIKNVAPRPNVSGVFVRRTSASPAIPTESTSQLQTCTTCNAPRLRERLHGRCFYCGNPFFTGPRGIES